MTGAVIIQPDLTVLLDLRVTEADAVRVQLSRFAELVAAPEHIHTYRITPLSLWNAAESGMTVADVVAVLQENATISPPTDVIDTITDQMGRIGVITLTRDFDSGGLAVTTSNPTLLIELLEDDVFASHIVERLDGNRWAVKIADRGHVKRRLAQLGWPVTDTAGYDESATLEVELSATPRGYQADAVAAWWGDGATTGGNGVVVLPCGAGKTIVGLSAIVQTGARTLVIATNILAARQWITEALDKTDLREEQIGEYTGEHKEIRPVTVTTYQMLTWHQPGTAADAPLELSYPHLSVLDRQPWGLIVYDEVHLLPAPVFRATANLQAVRRLGLTATLVREDNHEEDVFSLVGPKRYDVPWKVLEAQGWIAPAVCTEVRVTMDDDTRRRYATAKHRQRHSIASSTPAKLKAAERIVSRHPDGQILIIGQYLAQLRDAARLFDAPLVTGKTSQSVREDRFAAFRTGDTPILVVSKIANFSIDLPEANVAIQLSGTFGSRQEEAQRLGRIVRPKADGGQAHFYSVVAADSIDVTFATKRQRFLAEQGYDYTVVHADFL